MPLDGSGLGSYGPSPAEPLGPFLERPAEVARVEQDDLHAPLGRSKDLGVVDPLLLAPRRIGGHGQEIEQGLLCLLLVRVFGAGVVLAEIVIVPGAEHGAHLPQLGKARLLGNLGILLGEGLVLGRLADEDVVIHVVAQKHKQVRPREDDGVPDGLRLVLVHAGAEGNARDNHVAGVGRGADEHHKE